MYLIPVLQVLYIPNIYFLFPFICIPVNPGRSHKQGHNEASSGFGSLSVGVLLQDEVAQEVQGLAVLHTHPGLAGDPAPFL